MQRLLERKHENLVIGGDMLSLAFAHGNNYPVVFLKPTPPLPRSEEEIITRDKATKDWSQLFFLLGIANNMPYGNLIQTIRLEKNIVKLATASGTTVNITFDNLFIGDDTGVEGLPVPDGKTSNLNFVVDWFDVNAGAKHQHDLIEDPKSSFVKKVVFYLSQRSSWAGDKFKDCYSISLLTDKELTSENYSDNMARLKTRHMMIKAGVKGRWDKTNNYFRKTALTTAKREVVSLGKNIYSTLPDGVKLITGTPEEYLKLPRKQNLVFDYLEKEYGIAV